MKRLNTGSSEIMRLSTYISKVKSGCPGYRRKAFDSPKPQAEDKYFLSISDKSCSDSRFCMLKLSFSDSQTSYRLRLHV
ncbi:hypothetical protein CANARDRAFT_30243 [[Candida] arabinofermentans NRRL YB-2248]|uniref:Uncharacterized protein n=1 Tax=[Candida] arabinofermentans NRRL YB-2248 TaxID=983967 RepID=A0A1E4SUJ0_9ASCO|nr:hypothetical protein CANARDRAFT_30243 [[Candida] arabinofermentans NRRL YB-2248]